MSQPLTDAIVALTTYANTVTGASDTTLSDAVASLANGYGGGGVDINDVASCSLSGSLTFSTATIIKTWAFYGYISITSVSSNSVTKINGGAFRECTGLLSASFPNCNTFSGNDGVFYNATHLAQIYFPELAGALPNYAFRGCAALTKIAFPKLDSVYTQVFDGASSLTEIDIGGQSGSISTNAFKNASSLNVLILRQSSVKTLANINAFDNTPFASGKAGGTLYVPNSLISSYQSASNWSTILGYANNSIQKIEGSAYENAYADGTPISS